MRNERLTCEFIPLGGNAYSVSDGEKLVIGEEGIESWTKTEKKLAIYFYSAEESNCNLTIPIETNQNTITYSISLNDDFFEIVVLPDKSEIKHHFYGFISAKNTHVQEFRERVMLALRDSRVRVCGQRQCVRSAHR